MDPLWDSLCRSAPPQAIALRDVKNTISYEKLFEKTSHIEKALRAQGITQKDRVAFVAYSDLSSILLLFALLNIGASVSPCSFRIPHLRLLERLHKASFTHLIDKETLAIQTLGHSPDPLPPSTLLLFTSGSEGPPKLAALSVNNFYKNALGTLSTLHLELPSSWLLSLPLFHVSGIAILFRCLASGQSITLCSSPLLEALQDPMVSHASFVPTQLIRLLQEKPKFPFLRCALLGGAPIPYDLFIQGIKQNIPLFATYGMTEMASQIATACHEVHPPVLHFGKPLPYRDIKIDETGEILVRGDCLFLGYVGSSGITRPSTLEGWFPTKDLGNLSSEGFLIWKGRKDHLFICGGENVYPEEIEKALCEIEGVWQAVAVPVEDPEFGSRPIAFIDGSCRLSKEAISASLREKLPSYALPIDILPFPEHLQSSWKVDRMAFLHFASQYSFSRNS